MARNRTAKLTFWNGDAELEHVSFIKASVLGYAAPVKLPGVHYAALDGSGPMVQAGKIKGIPTTVK